MDFDLINIEAFSLVELVNKQPREIITLKKDIGSLKEKDSIDIGDKIIGNVIERTANHKNQIIAIHIDHNDDKFGFNKVEYLKFNELIQKLLLINEFKNKVSFEYVESLTFKWIVDVYRLKQAHSNLVDYLISSINNQIKPITFFFPIVNLEIEESFSIGNVIFTYFTKEYMDELFNYLKKQKETISEEIFNQLYRKDYQGQVIAKITIQAESNKAEELAKKEAELAVDILKLYSESVIIPEAKSFFDLTFRLTYQSKSDFLSQQGNLYDYTTHIRFNNHSYNFTNEKYLTAYKSGLNIFSKYISKPKNDELFKIIVQSINLFSSAISNSDLHLRCVNLITVIESLFLNPDEKNNLDKKTKARLSKIITTENNEKERIKTFVSSIYQVRHKMIHKAIRLDININELREFQVLMVNVFIRLIELNTQSKISSKNDLIEMLNIIKS